MAKATIIIPCTVSLIHEGVLIALQIISITKSTATGIMVRIRKSIISTSRCDMSKSKTVGYNFYWSLDPNNSDLPLNIPERIVSFLSSISFCESRIYFSASSNEE